MFSSAGRQLVRGRVFSNARSLLSIEKVSLQSKQVKNLSSIVDSTIFPSVRAVPSTQVQTYRFFSDGKPTTDEQKNAVEEENPEEDKNGVENDESHAEEEVSEVDQLQTEVKKLKDQLLRALAESENTRRIAKRDVASARSFAVTSFAKSLLDTSDNLTRAMDAVPTENQNDTENHPVLATLYEGIKMTDDGLTKALEKNGLKRFAEVGEKFDPNKHEALFEYPDPEKEAGTIGQIMKVGFTLNNRVLRSAEVGIVKKA